MVRKTFAIALLPLALQWSVADRMTGPRSVGEPADTRSALVRATLRPPCPPEVDWRLDDREVEPRRAPGCAFELAVAPGAHLLEARTGDRFEGVALTLRDHLVVSLGDSVASGEGNPQAPPDARWLDPRCHDSLHSAHAQAARALERADRTSVVTFVSLACSGGTIDRGLLGAYDGIAPRRGRPLAPQVERLRRLAPGREVGAVLLNVGANDVHFGPLVRFCAHVERCQDQPFDPARPGSEPAAGPTAQAVVDAALNRLRARYAALAVALRARVAPERVVVVQYFDPLTDRAGDTCASALAGRIDRDEAQWARTAVLARLNAEVEAAAARHGWRLAGGVAEAYRGHGVCAGRAAWVRNPGSALAVLTPTGILHPNRSGHRATAALIAPVLAEALDTDPHGLVTELVEGDGGEGAGSLWFGLGGLVLGALLVLLALRFRAVVRGLRRLPGRFLGIAVGTHLWALGAALAAFLAFEFEPLRESGARRLFAVVAIGLGAAYFVATWRVRTEVLRAPTRLAGALTFAVVLLFGLVALGAAFLGTAVLLAAALEDRIAAVSTDAMTAGVVVAALVAAAFVGWAAYCFGCVFFDPARRRRRRLLWSGLVGVAGTLALLPLTNARQIPNERAPHEVARQALRGQYDLLLVVDPNDPLGFRLVERARRYVAQGRAARLLPDPASSVRYDVAYGLAVPQEGGDGALWRLVEPPTTDREEVVRSLAALGPPIGPRAPPRTFGRVLADALGGQRMHWRPGAQRGLALVLDRLPSRAALDARVEPGDVRRAPAGPAGELCARLLTRRQAPHVRPAAATPVPWADALALGCARFAQHRQWERDRRLTGRPGPPGAVALHVVTRERRPARLRAWASWARALDGRLLPAGGAREIVRAARDAHTGVPAGDLARLVEDYRPHLLFDADERFFPVDVDALLREGGHRQCDRTRLSEGNCEELDDASDLAGSLDEYIDFAGGTRHGRDLWGRDGGPARMYVHVREHGGRLYLGYWWYFLFNGSPYRPEVNCLPGITWKSATCHDHEGDWEGVTVVLRLRDPDRLPDPYVADNVREAEAAVYDAHGRSVRWDWSQLDLVGDRRRGRATHPAVYVAAGSHASYPRRCLTRTCNQELSGQRRIPDGGFDGEVAWPFNDDARCAPQQVGRDGEWIGPCVAALPATRDGRLGMMWNAFPGAWGRAVCIRFSKICSQVDGPRSPSHQGRFAHPWSAKPLKLNRG